MTDSSRSPSATWDDLDHSSAAILLAGHLTGLDHFPLEPFGSGDFTLAFRQGNQVIRMSRRREAADALLRESCVLAKIAPMLPLPVPKPTYYAIADCPPFTIHDEVVGEFLTREMWESMSARVRDKAASDLATFLKTLHSLPVEIGLTCGVKVMNLPELASNLHRRIANTIHGLLDRQTQARLAEVLESWSLPSRDPKPPVLLHCDIGPGHVLYNPQSGDLSGVIDFSDLIIGDPARDFIYIYEDYGPLILDEVLARYAGPDAGFMMPAIRKWYLLEAITWTVDMFATGRRPEVEHGLGEIRRELADL